MNDEMVMTALHGMDGIGWKTIACLTSSYPLLSDLLGASAAELRELGIPKAKSERLLSVLTEDYVRKEQHQLLQHSITALTRQHPSYPELLKEIAYPPWVLYARGNLHVLSLPSIAVVGTRTPTVYGKRIAGVLAHDLTAAGLSVVSGMARGIDGEAHLGALAAGGSTIAVLGCGIDMIYPQEHSAMYKDIWSNGLILSEYPMGTMARSGLFPLRNRIIAGMTLGTLVVEAATKSGSLQTVDYALNESRDVFAVPGPVTSPKSMSTNKLIQSGAKLVITADDVLKEFERIPGLVRNTSGSSVYDARRQQRLTQEEQSVLEVLAQGSATIDEIIEQLQTNFGHLHSILLSLLLKKRIEQLPGFVYALI